jgi:hypothetical protein
MHGSVWRLAVASRREMRRLLRTGVLRRSVAVHRCERCRAVLSVTMIWRRLVIIRQMRTTATVVWLQCLPRRWRRLWLLVLPRALKVVHLL